MKCPDCGYPKTGTVTTDDTPDHIHRIRGCHKCGCNFKTSETLVRITSRVENGVRLVEAHAGQAAYEMPTVQSRKLKTAGRAA